MRNQDQFFPYILGIDVGIASIGLAVIPIHGHGSDEAPEFYGFVRTYPLPEGAAERREKRGSRRNTEREHDRLDTLGALLHKSGVGYPRKSIPKALLDISPIKLRAMASRGPVSLEALSRALLHMAKHRGSSAIRDRETKDGEQKEENRITAVGMDHLQKEIKSKGFTTYGQYLRWREKQKPRKQKDGTQVGGTLATRVKKNSQGTYEFYPSRQMIYHEFEVIWTEQSRHHKKILTEKLKSEVEEILFRQRPVITPPPANCPYIPEETRLPRCSRAFQVRRIYEDVNHLRFHTKQGEAIPLELAQRDKIVAHLMNGETLTYAEVKKTLGFDRSVRTTMENAGSRKDIKGYPFDTIFGEEAVLGTAWASLSEAEQDQILDVLATEHDDKKAVDRLVHLLGGNQDAAERVLRADVPRGWGQMGPTATRKMIDELRKNVIAARQAEDRAQLVHAMAPTGEIRDRLPYYGEILTTHTMPPIWVMGADKATDIPPPTNANEKQYGRVPNPVVHLALRQIGKAVNDIISQYGVPEKIRIELARELGKSTEKRQEIIKQIDSNTKRSDEAAKAIREIGGVAVSRRNIQKYQLWKEQKGRCIYTGTTISLGELFGGNYDIDHLLPRSKTLSDSMANKVVAARSANAHKGNRPPHAAFADHPDYNWEAILRQVETLQENKQWRFTADAMKRWEDDEKGFLERHGRDNSYIARLARQYLSCLYGDDVHVEAVSSYIVSMLRHKWGLTRILGTAKDGGKARDDHRHHFIDALVTGCTSRKVVQAIQTEAKRCEKERLDDFIKNILPPFGTPKTFHGAVEHATLNNVLLSRKPDHGTGGQLHEGTLLGIVNGPDTKGRYTVLNRKKLTDYATLSKLEKPRIKNTLADTPEIEKARLYLEDIKKSVGKFAITAKAQLEAEREEEIAAGKKGRTVSEPAIYTRAIELHRRAGGKTGFTLYEKTKLVNIQRAGNANRQTGGYRSGRNHRMDFFLNAKGKLKWQLVSMMAANDQKFLPDASLPGHELLWSAHKEDVLEMDDPTTPEMRVRMIVTKLKEGQMGIVRETDARDSKRREIWERGLSFFANAGTQRVVTNSIGTTVWHFPALPKPDKKQARLS